MTLWYGATLAAVLAVFSATVYFTVRQHLATRADRELADELVEVRQEIEVAKTPTELRERLTHRFGQDASLDFDIRNKSGETVFRSARLGTEALPPPPQTATLESGFFTTALLGKLGQWRIASQTTHGPEGVYLIQVARSIAPENGALRELSSVLMLIGPLALAAALAGGYWLAKRALAPVDRMICDAEKITAARLDRRLPVIGHDDEIDRLAGTLNRMMERLQRSFEEMQQFTADAAHELRTPLAVMQTAAEVALRSARDPAQYRIVLESLMEEMEKLTRLAGQLLYLCREDSGQNPPPNTSLRLDELLCEVAEHMKVVADEKGLALSLSRNEACSVVGDVERLRRALFNLIDNAIKYTDSGGSISLSVTSDDRFVRVIVTDTGSGVAAEHLPHIFQRFYRPPGSTNNCPTGTGLGLAICKAIIDSHRGTIAVQSKQGEGSRFTISLPITEPVFSA